MASAELHGPKVLLLDDDKFLLEMYRMKFSSAGYAVEACSSVGAALTLLRGPFSPDVILFDMVMPTNDGFDFLRSLKTEKLAHGALLIALTNQSAPEEQKTAEELGVKHYITKAATIPSEVVNRVDEALGRKGKA